MAELPREGRLRIAIQCRAEDVTFTEISPGVLAVVFEFPSFPLPPPLVIERISDAHEDWRAAHE